MTVKELYAILTDAVARGHGDAPVLFDTEAQTYNYHMASVDKAYLETEPSVHLALHEDAPHRSSAKSCQPSRKEWEESVERELQHIRDELEHHYEGHALPCYVMDETSPKAGDAQ